MVRLGDTIKILNVDGQYSQWTNRTWVVKHIARNERQHQGYDNAMNGEALVSCNGLPVSLYEYEIEVV